MTNINKNIDKDGNPLLSGQDSTLKGEPTPIRMPGWMEYHLELIAKKENCYKSEVVRKAVAYYIEKEFSVTQKLRHNFNLKSLLSIIRSYFSKIRRVLTSVIQKALKKLSM